MTKKQKIKKEPVILQKYLNEDDIEVGIDEVEEDVYVDLFMLQQLYYQINFQMIYIYKLRIQKKLSKKKSNVI